VTVLVFANRSYAILKGELVNVGAQNVGRKALDMFDLGRPDLDWVSLARGMGVPQDLVQSWLWFSLAAQQGDTDAGKKRDDVAAKMDAQALLAAAKALAAFQVAAPAPAANEAATPPGGWDAKTGSAQATPGHGGATTL